MSETIAEILNSRKGKHLLLILTVVLVGALCFGLGRLSHTAPPRLPVVLTVPEVRDITASLGARGESGIQVVTPEQVISRESGAGASQTPLSAESGKYVSSKNGTVYHLPWCSGAKRIKEENKRWFASKEEAESAGLRPAANCKGI